MARASLEGEPPAGSPACRCPAGFLARGRSRGPAATGAAYVIYCAACCGPYLAAAGIVAAASGGTIPDLTAVALHAGIGALPLVNPTWIAAAARAAFLR